MPPEVFPCDPVATGWEAYCAAARALAQPQERAATETPRQPEGPDAARH